MSDEAEDLRELLRWALQVIDDDLGYEVAQRNGAMYRRAKDAAGTDEDEEAP